MINAKIAVTTLTPAPTASPIITPIGERLPSLLPYVAVPTVTILSAKKSTPMITTLTKAPLTISFSGILNLLAKLQIASHPTNDQKKTVMALPMDNQPFGHIEIKILHYNITFHN